MCVCRFVCVFVIATTWVRDFRGTHTRTQYTIVYILLWLMIRQLSTTAQRHQRGIQNRPVGGRRFCDQIGTFFAVEWSIRISTKRWRCLLRRQRHFLLLNRNAPLLLWLHGLALALACGVTACYSLQSPKSVRWHEIHDGTNFAKSLRLCDDDDRRPHKADGQYSTFTFNEMISAPDMQITSRI